MLKTVEKSKKNGSTTNEWLNVVVERFRESFFYFNKKLALPAYPFQKRGGFVFDCHSLGRICCWRGGTQNPPPAWCLSTHVPLSRYDRPRLTERWVQCLGRFLCHAQRFAGVRLLSCQNEQLSYFSISFNTSRFLYLRSPRDPKRTATRMPLLSQLRKVLG